MKKFFALMAMTLLVLGGLTACSSTPAEEPTTIADLVVLFVPSRDPGLITEATEPLKQLLIDSLATKGITVENVTIEVTTDYNAAGEALAAGTAQVGFLPGGTYVAYHEDGVEVILAATRAGLNKDSLTPSDWNDGLPTEGDSANQVTYYRSLIYAGPSEYGRTLAAKVNAGEALTWDDVNSAKWCVNSSSTSSSGYIYPTLWLMDNFDKKITDLASATMIGGYSDIANALATETCDVGVGYADIRRDYADKWMTEWGRTEDIWNETDVIGVTEGIFNDTISVSLNSPDYSEKLATALQEAFIEIAQTDAGKEAIAIYNHEGYQVVTDADYDGARKAADVVQAS